jgi:hypothetical protein
MAARRAVSAASIHVRVELWATAAGHVRVELWAAAAMQGWHEAAGQREKGEGEEEDWWGPQRVKWSFHVSG